MLDPINTKYFRYAVGSDVGKETPNDISAKCVICGDSDKDSRQKRLHLYRKERYDDDAIHCFNCEFSGNMYSFLKEVNSNLFEQYKKEKRESSFANLKSKRENTQTDIDEVPSFIYKKKEAPKFKTFKLPPELSPAIESERATEYLNGRMIDPLEMFYSETSFKYNGKILPIKDCVVIPLWYKREDELVYGFQARSIEGKTFYTYIPDENSGMKIWLGIDFGEHSDIVLVAESAFDAMSMGVPAKYSGAILGASENDYFKQHYKKVVWCLDNQRLDHTAKSKTKDLLKMGEYVFIWPKGVKEKDFNKMKTSGATDEEIKKMIIENTYQGLIGISKLL